MATVNRSGTPEPRIEPSGASGSAATTNRRPSYPPFADYYHWNSPRETKGRSMSNCSIENATTLNLSLRLRGGGKVHGSLARAGKVKGQTPKVPKQEDSKKALTGRAKKRWQYNRRFVNVVAGMGGKKLGPNSNAAKN